MPKTLSMTRAAPARSAAPSDKGSQRAAIVLFLLAYIAVLGVLFAPKGFFLGEPAPVTQNASVTE
ncbi:hypothetical protein [Paragemmobacter ruber]|uniref:Uncharacterized protein n=1 Tax=Paragemmobacter ruber TaxID=1985673 RepID=A0ABW9Y8M6_9RHOB|nr:hypothetical protein [Rhodobacter ruber]NBE08955.1 hypothetical protein [Rhodobacter ruber]